MSWNHLYELPEVRPVSPIDPHLYSGEEYSLSLKPQPLLRRPPQQFGQGPWLSEISLSDDDITEVRSPWGSSACTKDSKEAMFEVDECSSSIRHQQRDPVRTSLLESQTQRFLPHWILALSAVIISILSTAYSYRVMVSQDAVPQALSLSPGQTVLVVNVLSHLVAFLCWTLFGNATESLRWALACRKKGVLLTTFLALSRATPLGGVAYLCLVKGSHQVWSVQRFISIVMVGILGLVLITDVTFKNIYNASSSTQPIDVVAGLANLNATNLLFAPKELLSLFITAYNMGFITDPKFVTSVAPISCGNSSDCTALFLPGGLELVRRQGNNENATLFDRQLEGDFSSIVIEDAPGFQLEFDPLPEKFVFDPADCKLYGQSILQGIYICMSKFGTNMLAGWSVCPDSAGAGPDACYTNTTWMNYTDWGLRVSLFRRFATVAYDIKNNSILTILKIDNPEVIPIDPSGFELYHDLALGPLPEIMNTSDPDAKITANSYTAQYGIAWLLGVYQSQFQSYRNGALDLLKGFLAVSFQFNTQMWSTLFFQDLPDDMKTKATLQDVNYRAIAQPWTVWAFAGLAFMILAWSIGCLTWVCFYGPKSPNASLFPEIDIASKSSCHSLPRNLFGDHEVDLSEDTLEDLGRLTRATGLGNGMSKAVVDGIRGKRIYCGSYQGGKDGEKMIVIATDTDRVGSLRQQEKYA